MFSWLQKSPPKVITCNNKMFQIIHIQKMAYFDSNCVIRVVTTQVDRLNQASPKATTRQGTEGY